MHRQRVLEKYKRRSTVHERQNTQRAIKRSSRWRLSLFEKVIVANSIMLVGEALVALWVTSHSLESHHYLIDTSFLVLAALSSLLINVVVLRASFRPLFRLLLTIRSVSAGQTTQRTPVPADPDIGPLTRAFNTMLDQLESFQREQTLQIIQAQEEERRRVARELHDETSQTLTALLLHTEILSQHVALAASHLSIQEQQQFEQDTAQLTTLAQETLDDIHVIAQQLRPSVLDDLGLLAALRWLAEDGRQRLHLHTNVVIGEDVKTLSLPPVYETTLFRIAQESLTNTARYANAAEVTIMLLIHEQQVVLTVRDDGQGFDTAQVRQGLGLRGMRERTALLQGTLTVRTTPGEGTYIEATLPLPAYTPNLEKGLR
jgi:two-component system sensor histidine kinase UhpB